MAVLSSGSEPGEPIPPPSPIPRYGPDTWAPWRKMARQDSGRPRVTGYQYPNPRPPRILHLEGRRISGYSDKNYGRLFSITTRNLEGKEERAGDHARHSIATLREFDGSTLTPSHLSGDEELYNWSVCFHYQ